MAETEAVHDARRREGLVALVFVQVCFGLFPVLVKLAQDGGEGFSTRALASWRISLGAAVLSIIAFLRHGRAFVPRQSDYPRLFLCAVLGIVLNQLLALEGAARTSAAQAGILFTLIPVFTYAVAALVRQEVLSRQRVLGIGVALVGAVILILGKGGDPGSAPDPIGGSLLLVANCLAYAVYLVLARKLLDHVPTLVVIAWVFVLSTWAPPLLMLTGDVPLWPETVSRDAWIGFTGLIVLTTILAYLLNTYALARVSASTTAVFIYLQPLVSIGAAVLVLGERPGPSAFLAGALLFAGIRMVVRRVDRTGGPGVVRR